MILTLIGKRKYAIMILITNINWQNNRIMNYNYGSMRPITEALN